MSRDGGGRVGGGEAVELFEDREVRESLSCSIGGSRVGVGTTVATATLDLRELGVDLTAGAGGGGGEEGRDEDGLARLTMAPVLNLTR